VDINREGDIRYPPTQQYEYTSATSMRCEHEQGNKQQTMAMASGTVIEPPLSLSFVWLLAAARINQSINLSRSLAPYLEQRASSETHHVVDRTHRLEHARCDAGHLGHVEGRRVLRQEEDLAPSDHQDRSALSDKLDLTVYHEQALLLIPIVNAETCCTTSAVFCFVEPTQQRVRLWSNGASVACDDHRVWHAEWHRREVRS